MTQGKPELFDRSVLVVSGKGGVGKTTVAAACARVGTRRRRRVLLAEIEGRGGLSRLRSGTRTVHLAEILASTEDAVSPDQATAPAVSR